MFTTNVLVIDPALILRKSFDYEIGKPDFHVIEARNIRGTLALSRKNNSVCSVTSDRTHLFTDPQTP